MTLNDAVGCPTGYLMIMAYYGVILGLASQRFPADELRASVSLACYVEASASIPVVRVRQRTTTNVCGRHS